MLTREAQCSLCVPYSGRGLHVYNKLKVAYEKKLSHSNSQNCMYVEVQNSSLQSFQFCTAMLTLLMMTTEFMSGFFNLFLLMAYYNVMVAQLLFLKSTK